MIRKILTAVVLVVAGAMALKAQSAAGEKSFGPKLGYVTRNHSAQAGLVFQYAFSQHVRISSELSCVFRNHNRDGLMVDVNMHFPLPAWGGKTELYPLAGLAFNSWADHGVSREDEVDVTTHVNRLGLNLGAGFALRCSSTMKVNIEAKYTLVKSLSSAFITAGISYIF